MQMKDKNVKVFQNNKIFPIFKPRTVTPHMYLRFTEQMSRLIKAKFFNYLNFVEMCQYI